MLKIERFVNQLMTSNCYIVIDDKTKKCIVIDPGSEKSEREIRFIRDNELTLDYILLTHEHTDHNWGVNALREAFPSINLVCSEECNKYVAKANKAYFLFYYDDPTYSYEIEPADIIIKGKTEIMEWSGDKIRFMMTPGHSFGSMCVGIENMLFTGDTIMPYKPYFNGRDGNEEEWNSSIIKIAKVYRRDTMVYPGHGNPFILNDWYFKNSFVLA